MNIYTKLRSLGACGSTVVRPSSLIWGALTNTSSILKPISKGLLSLSLLALLVPSVYAVDAPVPTEDADSVLSIFSDSYDDLVGTDFNPNWGQSTQVSTDGGELTYTSLNYQGTAFAAAQDVSGYGYLHVDYYATDSTELGIFLIGGGGETEVSC